MASEFGTGSTGAGEGSELEERVEILEERNRELEAENERLRSITGPWMTYRRASVLLVLLSAVALAGTVVYPGSRTLLLGIAGTGAFGAVLLGALIRERFLSAPVSGAIYDTLWRNETRLASRLRVAETSRYVPNDRDSLGVRLYLTRSLEDPIPPSESLDSTVFELEDHFALLLDPTGRAFVELYERTNDDLPESAQLATVVLREAVVQEFEHASLPRQSISTPRTAPVGNSCDSASESVLRDVFRLDPPVVRRPRSREGRRRAHRTGGVDRSERRRETRGRLVRRGARHGGAGLAVVGRDRNP